MPDHIHKGPLVSVVLPLETFPSGIPAVDASLSIAVMALSGRRLHGHASFLVTVDASKTLTVRTGDLGIHNFFVSHGVCRVIGSLSRLNGPE